MINPYDSSDQGSGEFSEMQRVIGEMLFRVLPRVDLATLIGNAEGIGYAIRYGFIETRNAECGRRRCLDMEFSRSKPRRPVHAHARIGGILCGRGSRRYDPDQIETHSLYLGRLTRLRRGPRTAADR